jgi:branched-chain amino acid transport system substrate-binding protein
MRNRKSVLMVVLLALGLLTVLFLTACGGTEETTTTAGPATTAAGPTFTGQITVGALGSLTGSSAMNGAETIWAQKLAAADINAAGGIKMPDGNYELVLKYVDDKSDATEAAAAIEKLIKVEGLKLILSTQVTPLNMAAAIVAEKYQALYQQIIVWTTYVREQNYQYCPDLFFPPGPGGVGEMPFWIWEELDPATRPTNWACLTEDNSDGQGFGEGVKEVAGLHGITLAEYQTYTPGTKDYSSIILKFKNANIDGLIVLVSASDGITFVKQMKEQDFSPKMLVGMKGFWPTEFMEGLGADSDYIIHDGFWSPDEGFAKGEYLADAYARDFAGQTSTSIGLPYAQVEILAQAIERAGSTDPAAVRDQIYNGSFPGTAMGDVQYDEKGVADISPVGNQWMDGNRILIWPGHADSLQYFKPWDER